MLGSASLPNKKKKKKKEFFGCRLGGNWPGVFNCLIVWLVIQHSNTTLKANLIATLRVKAGSFLFSIV